MKTIFTNHSPTSIMIHTSSYNPSYQYDSIWTCIHQAYKCIHIVNVSMIPVICHTLHNPRDAIQISGESNRNQPVFHSCFWLRRASRWVEVGILATWSHRLWTVATCRGRHFAWFGADTISRPFWQHVPFCCNRDFSWPLKKVATALLRWELKLPVWIQSHW